MKEHRDCRMHVGEHAFDPLHSTPEDLPGPDRGTTGNDAAYDYNYPVSTQFHAALTGEERRRLLGRTEHPDDWMPCPGRLGDGERLPVPRPLAGVRRVEGIPNASSRRPGLMKVQGGRGLSPLAGGRPAEGGSGQQSPGRSQGPRVEGAGSLAQQHVKARTWTQCQAIFPWRKRAKGRGRLAHGAGMPGAGFRPAKAPRAMEQAYRCQMWGAKCFFRNY
jgi:hypothetical protein